MDNRIYQLKDHLTGEISYPQVLSLSFQPRGEVCHNHKDTFHLSPIHHVHCKRGRTAPAKKSRCISVDTFHSRIVSRSLARCVCAQLINFLLNAYRIYGS